MILSNLKLVCFSAIYRVRYWPGYDLNSPPTPDGCVASNAASSSVFAPVTPEQGKQLRNLQLSGISHSLIDEGSSQRTDKQETLVKSVEYQSNGLLQDLVDSSSADVRTLLDENQASYGVPEGIDLNETPKQKLPRRRKHRPKVVVEGKPKRTPKPKDNSTETPREKRKYVRRKGVSTPENPTEKRKYVRRKEVGASATQEGNMKSEIKTPDVGAETKSCRRMLNFAEESQPDQESQDGIDDNQAEKHAEIKELFNLNLEFQDPELSAETSQANSLIALSQNERQQLYRAEKQHACTKVALPPHTNQMLAGVSPPLIPAATTPTANHRTLNVLARNRSMRNPNPCLTTSQIVYTQGQHDIIGEGIGHNILHINLERNRQPLQMTQAPKSIVVANEKRGIKRAYCPTLFHPQTESLMSSQMFHQGISNKDVHHISGSIPVLDNSQTGKRNKVPCMPHYSTTSSHYIPATHGCSREMGMRTVNSTYTSSSISNINGNNVGKGITSKMPLSAYPISANQYINPMAVGDNLLEQHTSTQVHLNREKIAKKVSQPPKSHDHSHNSQTEISKWNPQSPSVAEAPFTNIQRRKQDLATSMKTLSEDIQLSGSEKPSGKISGAGPMEEKEILDQSDQITNQLRALHISNSKQKEQNALVPYKGDGTIVPYENFESIKRRRPRPKVDLDPETNRLWNLLMGKEGSDSAETTNKHTEKWWEEERNVFQGRVDSFIARMHLVQGDRRFSPWKGSVVDSVIGVFLTQNVSDHLSSSAFMYLASRFPPKFSRHQTNQEYWWKGVNSTDEPVQIIDPDGTITYHATITRQPVYYQSSTTSSESSEQRVGDLKGTKVSSRKKNKRTNDEVISSETSPDSFICEAIEEGRSSSGSNSEVEDQIVLQNSKKNENYEISFHEKGRACVLHEHQNHMNQVPFVEKMPELGHQQPEYSVHHGQESGLERGYNTYAYPNKVDVQHPSNFNEQHVNGYVASSNHWSNMRSDSGLAEESSSQHSGKKEISNSMVVGINHPGRHIGVMATSANGPSEQLSGTPRETQLGSHSYLQVLTDNGYSQPMINNNQKNSSSSIRGTVPTRQAESLPKCQTAETTVSRNEGSRASNGSSNGRKRKVEGPKTERFDWDILRKQVQSKYGRKERNREAMDSLDYEALRHADVKVISDTIKERGMNNMLADRIKDFLNRLVREHERIDLEWLRDVPPDKAKDYLLSIRGLGLKSVECVRLLTLHNVAFPVDTNVGRIAVRLGWVPLQPLPESLQLHLLELYPVLESIQKYLWPRLCKLDQRTLYELHYQMITFGKVFCTKSKPNCNACPMRGECRHFASAFASARLALPGPEERSIVNSTAPPITVEEIPAPVMKQLALPSAEIDQTRETSCINCSTEPIVHEPTTPELPAEVTESDIEDAIYDDSDEIPTINLNMEEFTTNLQSFMQDVGLSRAIVALNPYVASIPTPKLKNVSRLRTEHQVYVLPDSHPLLEGLERRELDDPSPYLLAIWTPGETASSTQPPESKCDYQVSGQLCNEETCFSCNSIKEANSQTVRGTLLIPCRTAMRGSFPLNGTYFQVNEVFADHESSLNPIDVPRELIWNLPRRTVYFGTSVSSIFKGLTTEEIQICFWRGFVCVRGFDQKTRAPRPLIARLHLPASKMVKTKNAENQNKVRPS